MGPRTCWIDLLIVVDWNRICGLDSRPFSCYDETTHIVCRVPFRNMAVCNPSLATHNQITLARVDPKRWGKMMIVPRLYRIDFVSFYPSCVSVETFSFDSFFSLWGFRYISLVLSDGKLDKRNRSGIRLSHCGARELWYFLFLYLSIVRSMSSSLATGLGST